MPCRPYAHDESHTLPFCAACDYGRGTGQDGGRRSCEGLTATRIAGYWFGQSPAPAAPTIGLVS